MSRVFKFQYISRGGFIGNYPIVLHNSPYKEAQFIEAMAEFHKVMKERSSIKSVSIIMGVTLPLVTAAVVALLVYGKVSFIAFPIIVLYCGVLLSLLAVRTIKTKDISRLNEVTLKQSGRYYQWNVLVVTNDSNTVVPLCCLTICSTIFLELVAVDEPIPSYHSIEKTS